MEQPPAEKRKEEPVDEDIGDPKKSAVKVDCCDESVIVSGLESESMSLEQVHIEVGERVKLKRRKKKRSHSAQEPSIDVKISTKHKRKKHKHGEHSTKKWVPVTLSFGFFSCGDINGFLIIILYYC